MHSEKYYLLNLAIEYHDNSSKWAVCGDRVSIGLAGLDMISINAGSIIVDAGFPLPVSNRFRGQIRSLDLARPLTIGCPLVLHYLGAEEPAILSKLISVTTKESTSMRARCITSNVSAIVEIQTARAIPVENFEACKQLGRFTLRVGSASVAVGVVIAAEACFEPIDI